MFISAFFTNNGLPATGLSPTIRIIDIDTGSVLINDAAMTEVNNGFYKYNFIAYDKTKHYVIRCDGGSNLIEGERYVYTANENFINDIVNSVWSEDVSSYPDGSIGRKLNDFMSDMSIVFGGFFH